MKSFLKTVILISAAWVLTSHADCTITLGSGTPGAWNYIATSQDRFIHTNTPPIYTPDSTQMYCSLHPSRCVDRNNQPPLLYDLNIQADHFSIKRYACTDSAHAYITAWKRIDNTYFSCATRPLQTQPLPRSENAARAPLSEGPFRTEAECEEQIGADSVHFSKQTFETGGRVQVYNSDYRCTPQGPYNSVLICTMLFASDDPTYQSFNAYVCKNYGGSWVLSDGNVYTCTNGAPDRS